MAPFLTTFYYFEKRMESFVKIGGRGLKNLTYPYMGAGGLKIAKIMLGATDPFLTIFYYVEKRIESYVRIGGRGLKNLMYPYMG